MIIYADITFFNNFLMTLAIIWAVGQLLEYNFRWWRLLLAALIGTGYFFITLLLQLSMEASSWLYLLYFALNVLTALAMVRVAFQVSRKRFWKAVAYLYLISFITIGTTLSFFYIYGGTPFTGGGKMLFISCGILVLILLGNYGWRFFQSYITPEQFLLPVRISFQGRVLELTGLIDTGNSLTDPLTQVPVIIVGAADISPLLPPGLRAELAGLKEGEAGLKQGEQGNELRLAELFNRHGLGSRVRVLPFSGLGQERGMLTGFRPDSVLFRYGEKKIETSRIIVALSGSKLDEEGEYQVLVHPQIIKLYL